MIKQTLMFLGLNLVLFGFIFAFKPPVIQQGQHLATKDIIFLKRFDDQQLMALPQKLLQKYQIVYLDQSFPLLRQTNYRKDSFLIQHSIRFVENIESIDQKFTQSKFEIKRPVPEYFNQWIALINKVLYVRGQNQPNIFVNKFGQKTERADGTIVWIVNVSKQKILQRQQEQASNLRDNIDSVGAKSLNENSESEQQIDQQEIHENLNNDALLGEQIIGGSNENEFVKNKNYQPNTEQMNNNNQISQIDIQSLQQVKQKQDKRQQDINVQVNQIQQQQKRPGQQFQGHAFNPTVDNVADQANQPTYLNEARIQEQINHVYRQNLDNFNGIDNTKLQQAQFNSKEEDINQINWPEKAFINTDQIQQRSQVQISTSQQSQNQQQDLNEQQQLLQKTQQNIAKQSLQNGKYTQSAQQNQQQNELEPIQQLRNLDQQAQLPSANKQQDLLNRKTHTINQQIVDLNPVDQSLPQQQQQNFNTNKQFDQQLLGTQSNGIDSNKDQFHPETLNTEKQNSEYEQKRIKNVNERLEQEQQQTGQVELTKIQSSQQFQDRQQNAGTVFDQAEALQIQDVNKPVYINSRGQFKWDQRVQDWIQNQGQQDNDQQQLHGQQGEQRSVLVKQM